MLPDSVKQAMGELSATVITVAVIMVVSAFFAMLAARTFGGRSKEARNAIFSIVTFMLSGLAIYIYMHSGLGR